MSEIWAHAEDCSGMHLEDGTCCTWTRETPERCERCRNYLSICGHNLGFAEKSKSIGIDRTSLRVN